MADELRRSRNDETRGVSNPQGGSSLTRRESGRGRGSQDSGIQPTGDAPDPQGQQGPQTGDAGGPARQYFQRLHPSSTEAWRRMARPAMDGFRRITEPLMDRTNIGRRVAGALEHTNTGRRVTRHLRRGPQGGEGSQGPRPESSQQRDSLERTQRANTQFFTTPENQRAGEASQGRRSRLEDARII